MLRLDEDALRLCDDALLRLDEDEPLERDDELELPEREAELVEPVLLD